MRRIDTVRLTEFAKDWASTLLAFFIRQLYDWPGGVLLGLPMYFAGYLFRHQWVIGAMVIFLLWGIAIIWIAHAASGNDGRLATSLLLVWQRACFCFLCFAALSDLLQG